MAEFSQPTISVSLSMEPPTLSEGATVNLSVIAVSHAPIPITIFTWPTIFNLNLAQKRANFTCVDLNTNESVRLELTKGPKRPGFSRMLGGRDDAWFQTLKPNEPLTFQGPFQLAFRANDQLKGLVPGHRYRFGVREGETIEWWREGRKEDVMSPPREESSLEGASGRPIVFDPIEAIEFEVNECEAEISTASMGDVSSENAD